jgi:NAD(P)-dependent dehydrogenase (short-subunit alcohol dehydrogenase family)
MNPANIHDEASLNGQVAVVTGGGRGIGRATAIRLAEAGASVMVTARTEAEVQETADRICQEGGSARAGPADVSDWEAMVQLAEETERAFGPADVVVANAGVIKPVGDTWEVTPEAWAKNLTINLTSACYTVRAFLPTMVDRRRGVLIFVSSGAALHPVPGWSAYCAAKAGLDHFVRNLAAEVDQRGLPIRIHALYPGIVATSMQEEVRQMPEGQFPRVGQFRGCHERGWLRPPEEPATPIWWLVTHMAADFHGQAVSIDDATIRQRMADDLSLPPFKGRGE